MRMEVIRANSMNRKPKIVNCKSKNGNIGDNSNENR